MKHTIAAGLLAALALAGPARAGELLDFAGKAEQETQDGNHVEAISSMREGLYALWAKIPLQFRRGIFVNEKAVGYGVFTQRKNNVYKAGETVYVYAEPLGFGWNREGAIYASDLVADLELRDSGGRVLASQKAFGKFNLKSFERNTEYFLNLTYNFTGLRAGKYVIATILHDKVTGKTGSFDLPFEVR